MPQNSNGRVQMEASFIDFRPPATPPGTPAPEPEVTSPDGTATPYASAWSQETLDALLTDPNVTVQHLPEAAGQWVQSANPPSLSEPERTSVALGHARRALAEAWKQLQQRNGSSTEHDLAAYKNAAFQVAQLSCADYIDQHKDSFGHFLAGENFEAFRALYPQVFAEVASDLCANGRHGPWLANFGRVMGWSQFADVLAGSLCQFVASVVTFPLNHEAYRIGSERVNRADAVDKYGLAIGFGLPAALVLSLYHACAKAGQSMAQEAHAFTMQRPPTGESFENWMTGCYSSTTFLLAMVQLFKPIKPPLSLSYFQSGAGGLVFGVSSITSVPGKGLGFSYNKKEARFEIHPEALQAGLAQLTPWYGPPWKALQHWSSMLWHTGCTLLCFHKDESALQQSRRNVGPLASNHANSAAMSIGFEASGLPARQSAVLANLFRNLIFTGGLRAVPRWAGLAGAWGAEKVQACTPQAVKHAVARCADAASQAASACRSITPEAVRRVGGVLLQIPVRSSRAVYDMAWRWLDQSNWTRRNDGTAPNPALKSTAPVIAMSGGNPPPSSKIHSLRQPNPRPLPRGRHFMPRPEHTSQPSGPTGRI